MPRPKGSASATMPRSARIELLKWFQTLEARYKGAGLRLLTGKQRPFREIARQDRPLSWGRGIALASEALFKLDEVDSSAYDRECRDLFEFWADLENRHDLTVHERMQLLESYRSALNDEELTLPPVPPPPIGYLEGHVDLIAMLLTKRIWELKESGDKDGIEAAIRAVLREWQPESTRTFVDLHRKLEFLEKTSRSPYRAEILEKFERLGLGNGPISWTGKRRRAKGGAAHLG